MANVKITELTADTNPASTDVLPIVDVSADATKKVTIADLLENAGNGSAGSPAFSFDSDPDTGMLRSGADALGFATGGSERLKIDDSGRLLIGSSVAGNADADNINVAGAGNVGITFRGSSSGTGNIYFADSTSGDDLRRGQIVYDHSSNSLRLHTNVGERARLTSGGALGVGTTSPNERLHVSGSGGNIRLKVESTAASSYPGVRFTNPSRTYDIQIDGPSSSLRIFDSTASTERMRLNSSGDLLLGGTLPSSPNTSLNNDGSAQFVRQVNSSRTSDGYAFRAEYNGALRGGLYTSSTGSSLVLKDAGGTTNVSLSGSGNAEFAGSVSIGGTAAANSIDEYEEGNWTPGFAAETGSFTALTLENIKSTYTKIGRIVTVQAFIRTDNYDETGASGNLIITGLPFAAQSGNSRSVGSPLVMEYNTESSFTGTFAAYQPGSSTTTLRFARVDEGSNNGSANFLQVTQLQTTSTVNRNWMTFSLTYQAA